MSAGAKTGNLKFDRIGIHSPIRIDALMLALADGAPAPDPATLHIWRSSAGAVDSNLNAALTVERGGSVELNFLIPDDGSNAGWRIETPSASPGLLVYTPNVSRWSFLTAGINRLFLSAGAAAFQEGTLIDVSAGTLNLGFSGTSRIGINTTGLGFFATAPVARPTGVAVTAAGIHAALVTLGLITA